MVLQPLALEATSFAPFGWLPVADTDPADGRHTLWFASGDPHANVLEHRSAEIRTSGGQLFCDVLYRHRRHTQLLAVVDQPAVLAVAPPGLELPALAADGRRAADAVGSMAAFVVRPGQALVLHAGTWHWGPFPVGDRPVHLLNVQARSYLEDNEPFDLRTLGATVAVEPGQ